MVAGIDGVNMEAELILEDEAALAQKSGQMSLILGICGLVFGMGGIFTCPWVTWVTLPVSIAGIVKAVPAMKQPESQGTGTAGLVLSIIGSVFSAIGSIYAIFLTLYLAIVVVYFIVVIAVVALVGLNP